MYLMLTLETGIILAVVLLLRTDEVTPYIPAMERRKSFFLVSYSVMFALVASRLTTSVFVGWCDAVLSCSSRLLQVQRAAADLSQPAGPAEDREEQVDASQREPDEEARREGSGDGHRVDQRDRPEQD